MPCNFWVGQIVLLANLQNKKIMKNLILTTALLFSILVGFSQTDSSNQIKSQLQKIVTLDSKELPETMKKMEMVLFSFNVLPNGSIKVIDINYSNEIIKKAVIRKLEKAVIKNNAISDKVHYYKVNFTKL